MTVAERLFLTKGYDKTAVSNIVRELKVAQGTFYYHFSSKYDILKAIVEKKVFRISSEIKKIVDDEQTDPATKLSSMIDMMMKIHTSEEKLIDIIHHEDNVLLYDRLVDTMWKQLVPLFRRVLVRGKKSSLFDIPHPSETAEMIVGIIISLVVRIDVTETTERRERMRVSFEHLLVQTLGITSPGFAVKLS